MQGMLQRFRTLFNLPSMIRANISKGEYDLAIREYKKAKSLVLYSHVCQISFCLQITAFHADREKTSLQYLLSLSNVYCTENGWQFEIPILLYFAGGDSEQGSGRG